MAKENLDLSQRMYTLAVIFLVGVMGFWSFRMYEIWNTAHGNYAREISVEGQAKAYVTPDVGEISFGVNTDAQTSQEAVAENNQKMNAVMAKISAAGIDKKDVQTTGYSLNPKYNYRSDGSSYEDGYTLTQTVNVKVRDFTKIGDLVAQATQAGANMVGGVSFKLEDPETAKAGIRAEAIAKARAKAALIAENVGLKLGKVVSYYEYDSSAYPFDYGKGGGAMMADSAAVSAVPIIEPGQQEVALTVTLSIKLQ